MLLKRNPANIRKWICSGFCHRAFILRWKRVCIAHNNCMSCPSIWATLSALLINILLGSFQLFLHSDQPLSEWNNPRSAVSASRGKHRIIHAGGGNCFTHWRQTLWCATDDDQRQHHHAEHHFSFSINNSFVFCIRRSNVTLTHLHVSNCRVRQLPVLAFLSRWAQRVMALSR